MKARKTSSKGLGAKVKGGKAAARGSKTVKAVKGVKGRVAGKELRRPAKAPTFPVPLEVDGALKKQWEKALKALEAEQGKESGAFDRLWEAAASVVEHQPPLYLAGGLSTAQAFFQKHLRTDARSALRNIRVARAFTASDIEAHGVSKLDAALDLLEGREKADGAPGKGKGQGAGEKREKVKLESLRVSVLRGGRRVEVPFAEASVEEVRSAARALKKQTGGRKHQVGRVATALEAALEKAELGEVEVKVTGGLVTLRRIPVGKVMAVGAVLGQFRAPEE